MAFGDTVVIVEQLSCILSMIGSSLVALTWAFPLENRQKHGRILLLWLSLADFISSLIYFIQTFVYQSGDFCKTMALLGIFFPVASFLWTDFIAYYLYQAVVLRTNQMEWKYLLQIFHCLAWGISAVLVIFVAAFDHAGGGTHSDDIVYSNTGGWCWISGSSSEERFYWELIGGKVVEWCSCLIILPYLYASVTCKLRNIDRNAATIPSLRTTSVFKTSNNAKLNADINVNVDESFTIDTDGPRANNPLLRQSIQAQQQQYGNHNYRNTSIDNATVHTIDSRADTNIIVTEPFTNPSRQASAISASYEDDLSTEQKTDSYVTDFNRSKYACEESYDDPQRSSSQETGDMHLQSIGTAGTGSPNKYKIPNNNNSQYETPAVSKQTTRKPSKKGWFSFPWLKRLLTIDSGNNDNSFNGGNNQGGFFTKFYVKLVHYR